MPNFFYDEAMIRQNICEPSEEMLVTVWSSVFFYLKSLIKSHHVEARQDLGLQCKLWPEPNVSLSHTGQDKGGIFSACCGQRGG